MKLIEILADLLDLADKKDKPQSNDTFKKHWIKSIEGIDKSISNGYSLVGNFIAESEQLEVGLYLIYQEFTRSYVVEKSFVKWDGIGKQRRMVEDENGVVFEKRKVEEISTVRRGILFDVSDQVSLVYCQFLPEKWAKRLWKPIEAWLEQQPNIEAKIIYWQAEVKLRADSLLQAEQRLAALKQQIAGDIKELNPQTREWLQTAAVLGTKKRPEGDRLKRLNK